MPNPALQIDSRNTQQALAYDLLSDRIKRILIGLSKDFSISNASVAKREIDRTVDAITRMAARFFASNIKDLYTKGRIDAGLVVDDGQRYKIVNHNGNIRQRAHAALRYMMEAAESIKLQAGQIINAIVAAFKEIDTGVLEAKVQEFSVIGDWGPSLNMFVKDTVAWAVKEGKSRKEAQKWLITEMQALIDKSNGLIERNGKFYNPRSYFETVARTELANAYQTGIFETIEEYGQDLCLFIQHDSPCEVCAQYQNQVFSLTGKNPNYPVLPPEAHPPLHPRCECSCQAYSELGARISRENAESKRDLGNGKAISSFDLIKTAFTVLSAFKNKGGVE